jgi:hypothetical protein
MITAKYSSADERTLANGTLLPDVIGTALDAQLEVRMLAILLSAFTEADYGGATATSYRSRRWSFPWPRDWTGRCWGMSRSFGATSTLAAPTGSASLSPG